MLLEQEAFGSSAVSDSFLALKSTDLLVFAEFSSFAIGGFSVSIVIGSSSAARGEITEDWLEFAPLGVSDWFVAGGAEGRASGVLLLLFVLPTLADDCPCWGCAILTPDGSERNEDMGGGLAQRSTSTVNKYIKARMKTWQNLSKRNQMVKQTWTNI